MKNETFECEKCGVVVEKHPDGSARNHCPVCLYSKHLDKDFPGDRASDCHGLMKPVGVEYRKNKGNMIVHKCEKCGKEILNKLAPDDDFISFLKEYNKTL
ncbi:RNHCP domain-containing protein [Candidatus Gracilibacteria bacterium]|nr:RNHCP domain-containing protein [Candidatus Gracilibacteria bacterium]